MVIATIDDSYMKPSAETNTALLTHTVWHLSHVWRHLKGMTWQHCPAKVRLGSVESLGLSQCFGSTTIRGHTDHSVQRREDRQCPLTRISP